MKQLERLLFLQGQRCFFCQLPIPASEASVEHLVATSNGGGNDDDNCVVCCKAINAALGNLSVKAKLQTILNQEGKLVCPRTGPMPPAEAVVPAAMQPDDGRVAQVVAGLHKRGSARPRRLATLRNTISATFQKKISDDEVSALLARLQSLGYINVVESKVSYALPPTGV